MAGRHCLTRGCSEREATKTGERKSLSPFCCVVPYAMVDCFQVTTFPLADVAGAYCRRLEASEPMSAVAVATLFLFHSGASLGPSHPTVGGGTFEPLRCGK